ncbi:hypothetical protein [Rummeliibacillus pycnus]|uniref:hypothetical protein n=1 Tax=Rummeliibacillus pycnus TaxID=101070 RepID=UPI0037CB7E85
MPFYQPDPRRRPLPPRNRQGFGPPNQGRQGFGPPNQGRQGQRFFDPNQRPQSNVSRFERLPDHLNTIMGHAGTIKNGVNMVRQIGSFFRSFDGRRP